MGVTAVGSAKVTLPAEEISAAGGLAADKAWAEVPSEATGSAQAAAACGLAVKTVMQLSFLV